MDHFLFSRVTQTSINESLTFNLKKRKDMQIVHVKRLEPYFEKMEDEKPEIYTPWTELLERVDEGSEETKTASDELEPNQNDLDNTSLQRSRRKRRAPQTFY